MASPAQRLLLLDDRAEAFRDDLVECGMGLEEANEAAAGLQYDRTGWLSLHRLCRTTKAKPTDLFRLLQEHGYLPRSSDNTSFH